MRLVLLLLSCCKGGPWNLEILANTSNKDASDGRGLCFVSLCQDHIYLRKKKKKDSMCLIIYPLEKTVDVLHWQTECSDRLNICKYFSLFSQKAPNGIIYIHAHDTKPRLSA